MKGYIHSIQSMGTVDGPGVRCVVFLQGCQARCIYCHNPDTWRMNSGTIMEPAEVIAKIVRYRSYYGKKPGVTVSGGEALCQPEFVTELFELCRVNGIHTALDTSGFGEEDVHSLIINNLIDVTDLCLLDVKFTTGVEYIKNTGLELSSVLEFLKKLESKMTPTWIRYVVVPGLNDTKVDIYRLHELIKEYSCIEKLELLPFRKLCIEKYKEMGIPFQLENTKEASAELIKELYQYFESIK